MECKYLSSFLLSGDYFFSLLCLSTTRNTFFLYFSRVVLYNSIKQLRVGPAPPTGIHVAFIDSVWKQFLDLHNRYIDENWALIIEYVFMSQ